MRANLVWAAEVVPLFTEAFPIISTANLPGLAAFYRDAVGFTEVYRFPAEGEPAFVSLRLGTSELALGAAEEDAGPSPRHDLCVYAGDCDAAAAALVAAGAHLVEAPADQPWGERTARLTDPDGNRLLLCARL